MFKKLIIVFTIIVLFIFSYLLYIKYFTYRDSCNNEIKNQAFIAIPEYPRILILKEAIIDKILGCNNLSYPL